MDRIFGEGMCAAFIVNWTRIAPAVVEIAKTSTNKHEGSNDRLNIQKHDMFKLSSLC